MLKKVLALLGALLATAAGAVELKGADELEMSDGHVFRVAYSTRISTGDSRVTGSADHVWFEDGSGNLVAVDSGSEPDGLTVTRFAAVRPNDRIEIRVDYGYGKDGLKSPVQVTINGTKFRALLATDGSTAAEESAFRKKLAPALAKLSPGFSVGLSSLFSLGEAGYPQLGSGWMSLAIVFDKAEISQNVSIAAAAPMEESEAQTFEARFSK